MNVATGGEASDNLAWACCGRWAADRARFALYAEDADGRESAWTFWDIQREANRYSNVLAALGVMRGDRVALLSAQRPQAAAILIACWQMGAVAQPLPGTLKGAALAAALDGAQVAVADPEGQRRLEALPGRVRHALGIAGARGERMRDWNEIRPLASPRYARLEGVGKAAALQLGGGAPVSHAQLAACGTAFAAAHAGYPQAGDLFWSPGEWGSGAGLTEGLLPAWLSGQPVVAAAGRFDAEAAFALIAKYDVRNVRLSPRELETMMAAAARPDEHDCRLRTLATGGAALSPVLTAWARQALGAAPSADERCS
ncbi:MAG: AMP-binding protein [Ignavibacteria bacterium]